MSLLSMTPRVVALVAVVLCLTIVSRIKAQVESEDVRPNILWISCEDISPNLGCYGDPDAITPNLDALAGEGVRFTRAFTIAGVCAPNRSGTITGMYPSSIGSHNMRSAAKLPPHVKCFPEYLRRAGYYCTNNSKTDYNFPVPEEAWDECSGKTHWKNRPEGKPFFAVFNITTTHESQIRTPQAVFDRRTQELTDEERQDRAKVHLPPYYPDTPVVRNDWARYLELITALDYEVAARLEELKQAGLENDTIVFFWSDHGAGLPRAKRWLYDSGTRVPLIVRIPKRYRVEGQGEPGTVDERLVSFVDLAPTVLNLAGVPIAEHMQGRPFLGADLPNEREYVYSIRDRMDERYDTVRSVRGKRFRYIRNYQPWRTYAQPLAYMDEMPTMREMRRLHAAGRLHGPPAHFFLEVKPAEELYDTQTDPYEINNLADDPAHGETLAKMRGAHLAWMSETKDLGLLPEPELLRLREACDPPSEWGIFRDRENEHLAQRLYDVVTAGWPESRNEETLRASLGALEPSVRYWALYGLARTKSPDSATLEKMAGMLRDSSDCVRVAAAAALAEHGRTEDALPVLMQGLGSGNPWIRLQAAQALDALGPAAKPALALLKTASNDKENQYVARVAQHAVASLE